MKKVGLIGYYSLKEELVNGQTIKSKLVYNSLGKKLGDQQVLLCDYSDWKKRIPIVGYNVFRLFLHCNNIIMLPARNALKYLTPALLLVNKIFKRRLHYFVVGGWLIETLKDNPDLIKPLQKFDGIYVELHGMEETLKDLGFKNVIFVNKFRDIKILHETEINSSNNPPFKFCIFSRIMKEKGVEEAVNAIKYVNTYYGKRVAELDIYGQVYDGYEEWFEDLKQSFPDSIRYCGYIDYNKSNQVLKEYFALLFPTYYYGEGYPNTVVDAFAAGLPVIASDWNYNREVIRNGIDGILYNLEEPHALSNILLRIVDSPDAVLNMKKQALKRANDYQPEIAIRPLLDNLE